MHSFYSFISEDHFLLLPSSSVLFFVFSSSSSIARFSAFLCVFIYPAPFSATAFLCDGDDGLLLGFLLCFLCLRCLPNSRRRYQPQICSYRLLWPLRFVPHRRSHLQRSCGSSHGKVAM